MSPLRLLAFLLATLLSAVSVSAATFGVSVAQTDIAVPKGLNHLPLRLPITHSVSLSSLSVSSDSAWVIPTIDSATEELVLTFATTALTNPTYTATVSLTDGSSTVQTAIKATVSALNIVRLIDDPTRSRTYGLHQNGINAGAIVIYDPIQQTYVGCLTLGLKPGDFAVKPDGTELIAICSVSRDLYPVDLADLKAGAPISLTAFDQVSDATTDTSAHVAYGVSPIIYYTDSSWSPALRVLNRATGTVLQTLTRSDSTNSTYNFGFGAIAFAPDVSALFTWAQIGWGVGGNTYSYSSRFSANPDGTLALSMQKDARFTRDPLTTPVLASLDGAIVTTKLLALAGADAGVVRTLPSDIVVMSSHGELVGTATTLYETATGNALYSFPVSTPVQAITSDYARLVYFDSAAKALKSLSLTAAIGPGLLNQPVSPPPGATVLAPAKLTWSPSAGVDRYRVYLGTSSSAVAVATTAAPEYLGLGNATAFTLPTVLTPGTTYYWRTDAINGPDVTIGEVRTFTVATITTSVSTLKVGTVQGDPNCAATVSLTSTGSTQAWSAAGSAPWISVQPASGTTPSTLAVRLDASQLPAGLNTGSILITAGGGSFSLPVELQVDPLGLTVMRSDPHSARIYAISEPATTGVQRAYLLEIDSTTEAIVRTLPLGNTATDLALHEGDNRLYVTNWNAGSVLAVDRSTFRVVRSYPFRGYPFSSSRGGDAYRLAAGAAGRLLVEGYGGFTTTSIIDTVSGTQLTSKNNLAGNGLYGADKRYYYRGISGSPDSTAAISRYDTVNDTVTFINSAQAVSVPAGSRVLVVSEDGTRIFWGGGMYDTNLGLQWGLSAIIYAASGDGRYAFSDTSVYDTVQRKVIFAMPTTTQVSAVNSTSGKLVIQEGVALAFYPIDPSLPRSVPTLTATSISPNTVKLAWASQSLGSSFSIQERAVGTADWLDFTSTIEATARYTYTYLSTGGAAYEFRIRVNGPQGNSDWSAPASATLLPSVPVVHKPASLDVGSVSFAWTMAGLYDDVSIERRASSQDTWGVIATVPAGTLTYTDTGLAVDATYTYRLRARHDALYSSYTSEYAVYAPPASAPAITVQPISQTDAATTSVKLNVFVSGFPAPTYQWRKNGEPIPGATDRSLPFAKVQVSDGGTYDVVVTNPSGTVTSSPAILAVVDLQGTYFGSFNGTNGYWALLVASDGSAKFLGYLNQPHVAFQTAVFVVPSGQFTTNYGGAGGVVTTPPPDIGSGEAPLKGSRAAAEAIVTSFTVSGTLGQGTLSGRIEQYDQTLTGTADPGSGSTSAFAGYHYSEQIAAQAGYLYAIVGQAGQAVMIATTPDFIDGGLVNISASGAISGASASGGRITGSLQAGLDNLSVTVAPATGPTLTFQHILQGTARTDRLVNLSSRGTSGTGNRVMILGFVIGGSGPRNVLIRGVGPTLASKGVPVPMANPMVELFNSAHASLARNDDWSAAANAATVADAANRTGAFALPSGSRDASLLVQLNPGVYSAVTHDDTDTTGVALTEIYDVDGVDATTPALTNLSIRGNVDTGNGVLIAGFVVTGNSPKRVLIRAVGPTLGTLGLQAGEVLADPVLRIVQDGNTLLTNDNWGDAANASDITSTSSSVGAFALPATSKDAVILTTLAPGVYSAIASGAGGGTGIALVEVYQAP